MSMEADTAHKFWLGKVNVTMALAKGQMKAKGPVAKILKLVPLVKPVFPRYQKMLEEREPRRPAEGGRDDGDRHAGTAPRSTHYKNYIGGEWVDAASGETFDIVNPATEEVFATVPSGGREDAQRAIAAAREAFDSGDWSGMEPEERKRILLSVRRARLRGEDELADARDDAGRHDDPRDEHGRDRLLRAALGLLRAPGDAADAGAARAGHLSDPLLQLRAARAGRRVRRASSRGTSRS